MRVLVCGDRNWFEYNTILQTLSALGGTHTLIHGAARGADTMASLAATQLRWETKPFPAQWDLYGKGAGPIRNQQMLDEGKPDKVIAFHHDIKNSKGTADMVRRAKKAGIPVEVIE
jgi:hypothetical protein